MRRPLLVVALTIIAGRLEAQARDSIEYLQRIPPGFPITERDTARVERTTGGQCLWVQRTSVRPPAVGESRMVGERNHTQCIMVYYFFQSAALRDPTTWFSPSFRGTARAEELKFRKDSASSRVRVVRGQPTNDTLALKKLAAERIDTANAQVRIDVDTAWVWKRRLNGSIGVQLVWADSLWRIYKVEDTAYAVPARKP